MFDYYYGSIIRIDLLWTDFQKKAYQNCNIDNLANKSIKGFVGIPIKNLYNFFRIIFFTRSLD
jgi:hypothetical protein